MAQLLAPYHNGMRLGQGFNSYTQQICLDNAVLLNTAENRTKATDESTEVNLTGRPPWTKPQIVTYSSRFVDKLSDVTDSMNISGALSIQTATVGGKGSGSYVDSDKFKESDINFHLQVKVVNQIHKFDEYSLFNKIHTVRDADFPAVYGDTFISGWEEGGEFNAIISMKVTDKSKTFEVKASLEATLSLSGMKGGDLKVQFEMVKNNISKNTETTIAVNWSGGGSIKDPEEAWTMESMKKAAAAFPDLVAITPQRTYAILTKYIALESFQRQRANYSQLDYENAGIYTAALLDHYMDYKMMWKQLSQATYELEANRAKIDWAQLDEETSLLARINPLPDDDIGKKLSQSEGSAQDPFKPSFPGLIAARKICRIEMAKIVNEVDLVTRKPLTAQETIRDSYFLHPLIFKMLLPVSSGDAKATQSNHS
ncbi:hypothetical protein BU16DRAFT_457309 [Lophium mytilinum]|uniref:Uncharacterized protein n=1 Tax=Lophium mytilinum TaxID=390894 RepID=A0A6A6QZU9_9PEZI|nr:hypothetical protein BU16DRAFT_457309 [Lophium mytilinum]